MMESLTVDRLQSVGNGKHLRLRLRRGRYTINAIYFSATAQSAAIAQGDLVDVAFNPQINEFRDERNVQMNILDIRPSCQATCSPELCGYPRLRSGDLSAAAAGELLPDRATLATVWRYLAGVPGAAIEESPMCLCRKIVRWSGTPLNLGRMMVCLDIFCDVGLIQLQRMHKYISIRLTPGTGKADLNQSQTMQRLLQMKES
jgi:single-stranded-DNA-specific exonuclease